MTDLRQNHGKNAPISCPFCGGNLTIEDESQEKIQCPFCGETSLLSELMGDSESVRAERLRQKNREEKLRKYMVEERETFRDQEQARKNMLYRVKRMGVSLLALIVPILLVSLFLNKLTFVVWRSKPGGEELASVPQSELAQKREDASWGSLFEEPSISWERIVMAGHLPMPSKLQGSYTDNNEERLHITLKNVTEDDLCDYQMQCYDMGYVRERLSSPKWTAFDRQGYRLELNYNETIDQLELTLCAPIPLEAFRWDQNELTSLLPAPGAERAWVASCAAGNLHAFIGDMEKEEVDAYCALLEEEGFRKKESTWVDFQGENAQNVTAILSYYGNSIMELWVIDKGN